MRIIRRSLLLSVMAVLLLGGCTDGGATANRVQPNLVDKKMFEGEWWLANTAIDVDADTTSHIWSGAMGMDWAVDKGESPVLGRVRWVIEEKFLYAYRSYELVDGANSDADEPQFRGQPLAAFSIVDHVDVRPQYNPVTGESRNVIEENTEDRRWFERDFMRVDWSANLIDNHFYPMRFPVFGNWTQNPSFFVQEGSSHCYGEGDDFRCDFPKSWEPQFVSVGADPDYRFANEWPEGSEDLVHYMSFVTLQNWSPDPDCLLVSGVPCRNLSVPNRMAFLRVPPEHQYASARQSHEEFDKFGLFRTYQRTYLRGGVDQNDFAKRCDRDADCGAGGYCDPDSGVCAGGLAEDHGETDALAFLRPRHNFFEVSLTDEPCIADWECDGRSDYRPGREGSVCDRAAKRCTVPMKERRPRRLREGAGSVQYHLNEGFPVHLVHAAMEVMGNWNEVFMRGWRAATDRALPDYASVRLSCQTTDPTRYCFCGSPDDVGGTCKGKYDPFVSPSRWQSLGVADPYQCQVENLEFEEPASPTSYDDYPLPQAYRYQFVGDECLFVLRSNACDWYRQDASTPCDEVLDERGEPVVWQQLGDIRYQFFHYIDQVNTSFGGVSALRVDPTTGELVSANASFSAAGVERRATQALDFFPVLRCANEDLGCEPGDEEAAERYLSGENLRSYFSRLGRTEHPVGLAASGSDGFSNGDPSRPALPVDVHAALRKAMDVAVERTESLRGIDGRAQIMSDRMRRLQGTPIEQKLMGSLGPNGFEALSRHFDHGQDFVFGLDAQSSIYDAAVLDQISPFRGSGFMRTLTSGVDSEQEMSDYGICPLNEPLFRSRYAEYWAEAFRGRPPAEASIRMQQLYARSVQHHEIGHSVGLRHNFGASLDRQQYGDGYFNVVLGENGQALPLPRMQDYDLDDDGFVAGSEFDVFLSDLREVRDQRAARGAHNYMTSSTMDYNGDSSDAQGLGRYDVAATLWNYFDLQEAFDLRSIEGELATDEDSSLQGLKRSHEAGRVWWRSYLGGQSCSVDADCPYSKGSEALVQGQPVYQRCVQNPRFRFPQEPCRGHRGCLCSSFDADMQDYDDFAAYPGSSSDRDFASVKYLFCPDERSKDISWCNPFDAGESFEEVIDHYRRGWEERYPVDYYRRFQRRGARGAGATMAVSTAAKIFQHLFFRYNFEPGFSSKAGPLGFEDQFLASIEAMNWFIELVNLPNEGSYEFDAGDNAYRWIGESIDLPSADISLLPGQGFGMWTKYQDGYFGFFRPERAGVFYDKMTALLALAKRDWNLDFNVDERYFINFYDLFPTEMTELFGGLILQDERWFAPRLLMRDGEPVVQHMSWYRGLALGECVNEAGTASVPCRGSQPEVYPGPVVKGTSNEILRSWAAILALAQFPVYYDTTFEQRLLVFKAGSGVAFDIADVQPDGSPTCVYGSDGLGAGHFVVDPAVPNGCDYAQDADYVVYESDRFRTPYVAVKVRPSLALNLEEEQIGFQLLRRLVDLQNEVRSFQASDPARNLKLQELQQGESFLEYLIELQKAYGISNFF